MSGQAAHLLVLEHGREIPGVGDHLGTQSLGHHLRPLQEHLDDVGVRHDLILASGWASPR